MLIIFLMSHIFFRHQIARNMIFSYNAYFIVSTIESFSSLIGKKRNAYLEETSKNSDQQHKIKP